MKRMIGLLIGLVLVVLLGCSKSPTQSKRGQRIERLPRVEVVQSERKRLVRRLDVAATVEALKRVDVAARVPGIVAKIDDKMDIGKAVRQGDVLVQLAVPELEADLTLKQAVAEQSRKQEVFARASRQVAEREVEESEAEDKRFVADVNFAKQRYMSARDLVRQKAQQPQVEQEALRQLEAAEAMLSSNRLRTIKRRARVEAARAEEDLSKQRTKAAEADAKRLQEMVGFATVKAPFDGVITRRSVDPGAIIKDPGTPLLTLMQMERVRVLIDIPQRDIALLNSRDQNPNPDGKGDLVTIRIPALRDQIKNGELEGYITRFGQALDPITRTMRAEIEVDNPNGWLRPGMYGSASVLVENRSNVLALPASALVRRGEGLVEVYQVADIVGEGDERRGVLKLLPVVLGLDDGKEVEIRSGLTGTEWIVERATGAMRADEAVLALMGSSS
jgi:RND family efflux transporter MFP subunit